MIRTPFGSPLDIDLARPGPARTPIYVQTRDHPLVAVAGRPRSASDGDLLHPRWLVTRFMQRAVEASKAFVSVWRVCELGSLFAGYRRTPMDGLLQQDIL